jgi:hypothetical protein
VIQKRHINSGDDIEILRIHPNLIGIDLKSAMKRRKKG